MDSTISPIGNGVIQSLPLSNPKKIVKKRKLDSFIQKTIKIRKESLSQKDESPSSQSTVTLKAKRKESSTASNSNGKAKAKKAKQTQNIYQSKRITTYFRPILRPFTPINNSSEGSSQKAKKKQDKSNPESHIQELSIHKINLKAVKAALTDPKEEEKLSLEDLAKRIVDLYNKKREDKKEPIYSLVEGISHPKNLPSDGDFASFDIIVYKLQKSSAETKLTKWLRQLGATENFSIAQIHFLFFFCRKDEMFALTSNQAYHVIQKFIDYRFPLKVARRLMSSKVSTSQRRPIVGNVLVAFEALKKAATIPDSDAIDMLFTRVTFNFRKDSSLFNFSFFQTKKGKPLAKGVRAEFGLGFIRFTKQITPSGYSSILDHFSIIANEGKTYSYPEGDTKREKESSKFDFLGYFLPADFNDVSKLNQILVDMLYKTVIKSEKPPTLDFCHKKRIEYLNGSEYLIHYDGSFIECTYPHSASWMISSLKGFPGLKNAENAEVFATELLKVKVSFVSKGKKMETPFIDLLEGEVQMPNGQTFWRLHTMWFRTGADYLGLIQQEFGRLISKVNIKTTENEFLTHLWPSHKEKEEKREQLLATHKQQCKEGDKCKHKPPRYNVEREYNASYLNIPSFLPIDGVNTQKTHEIELCDLIFFHKDKVYFYHIKEGFGQKTRDACSQIRNAAKLIHHQHKKGTGKTFNQILRSLYQTIVEYGKKNDEYHKAIREKLLKMAKDEESFLKLFRVGSRMKEIVFVYAFADDKVQRFISEEVKLRNRIKPHGIDDANKKFKGFGKQIFASLQKDGYLLQRGFLSSKFLASSEERFKPSTVNLMGEIILDNKNQRHSLFTHLSRFKSKFDSTIAKLEIIGLQKELSGMGFEFKICQINRTDYTTAPVLNLSQSDISESESEQDENTEDAELDKCTNENEKEEFSFKKDEEKGMEFSLLNECIKEAGSTGFRCAALSVAKVLISQFLEGREENLRKCVTKEEKLQSIREDQNHKSLSPLLIQQAIQNLKTEPAYLIDGNTTEPSFDTLLAGIEEYNRSALTPINTSDTSSSKARQKIRDNYLRIIEKNGQMLDLPFFVALGLPFVILQKDSNDEFSIRAMSGTIKFSTSIESLGRDELKNLVVVFYNADHYQSVILENDDHVDALHQVFIDYKLKLQQELDNALKYEVKSDKTDSWNLNYLKPKILNLILLDVNYKQTLVQRIQDSSQKDLSDLLAEDLTLDVFASRSAEEILLLSQLDPNCGPES